MRVLAIIPARGGSKSIPKKNIVLLGGKPLLAWTIIAAKKSKYIDRVVVSSDDDEILTIAEKYGGEAIRRPKRFATDTSKAESVITHALSELARSKYVPEWIVYLQPTSPLRDSRDIDAAMQMILRTKADVLNSVEEIDKKLLKMLVMDKNGYLKPLGPPEYPFLNRQQLPSAYLPNGAIYIVKFQTFRRTKKLFSESTLAFVMDSERSIDLDTREDLTVLRRIFLRKGRKK